MTADPTTSPRRRTLTLRWVLAGLLLLPVVEIVLLVMVGQAIGLGWTLLLLLVMAVLGAWLARRETGRTFRALQASMRSGRMPTDEATDAIIVMVGGVLLLLPGFLTDVVGVLLVLPFTRPVARRLLQTVVAARVLAAVGAPTTGARRPTGRGDVIEGEVISHTPPPGTTPTAPPSLDR
ncbi:FxsA family protein [Ornithinimicrobium tianjinense]|uniref:Uncharacterized protein n=1 Tax=Ornithinimicrobium tianjinense TaxID=1195761 RepID=A0A917BKF4_9MICO|nr:FxsA family protein [Ornithinimicrobium tianjinense]GGF47342.1 hypothetical protein GCM10011366_13900 [Ornithinimicrobium tianjinense]